LQDSQAELAYRVAFRVSAFLGRTPDESVALYSTVLASYKARSKVVHGSSAEVPDLKTITADTSELLRKSLLGVLQLEEPFKAQDIEINVLRAAK